MDSTLEIIKWDERYREDFVAISKRWLEKNELMEAADQEMIDNPYDSIIRDGGMIFFASLDSEIVGTVALINYEDDIFELVKLGVRNKYRNLGVASALMETAINFAVEQNISKVILYTHETLETAIALYGKYGFEQVEFSTDDTAYDKVDMKMEKILN